MFSRGSQNRAVLRAATKHLRYWIGITPVIRSCPGLPSLPPLPSRAFPSARIHLQSSSAPVAVLLHPYEIAPMKTALPSIRSIVVFVGGITLAAGILGCGGDKKADDENKAPVKAEPAKEMKLAERTELIGVTQPLPNRVARITARVEGSVKYVLANPNGKPTDKAQPGV